MNDTSSTHPGGFGPGERSRPISAISDAADVTADDGLPEWEPLTPELVEDEAIRGDFVIRWVVVGLALLLGISQISETRTLVHLKVGQYLIGHGFLPSANDLFSYTANDRKWVNLPWLFDIAMAGVYAISGGVGLSIIQGLLACLAFGLLAHTARPNIRTWWGSICAVLALLACYPQFTIQPELVTLLGMSFTLWTLVRAEESGRSQQLWRLVPAMWLWAQCDQRVWLGWYLLILWTAGERFSRDRATGPEKGQLEKVTLASLVVVAIHPFSWESWLAPFRMYLTDYPAMRNAYPNPSIIDQAFYPIFNSLTINHRTVAAVVLMVATIVTLILNRARVRRSHLLAFVGMNALSLLASHELAVASLVNCVVCTLNAQAWYRERFGQVYSLDWRELLFSRGGRAVTVIGFFALSWLILSGRIDGPGGKRTGIGFDSHLAGAMADYQNLSSALVDDHPFHFSIRQGDLMIWGGQKTFVDSRAGLFYGTGDANLIDLHNKTRQAFRPQSGDKSEPIDWKATFAKYEIQQACPRLNGPIPAPDYATFFGLLTSPDFRLTSLNSSTAVFVRADPSIEVAANFLREHPFDLVELAFRTKPKEAVDQTRDISKVATSYDKMFSLRRPLVPSEVQLGQHFLRLAASDSISSDAKRCAAALLAIRHANEGLRLEPNSPDGYRLLGLAYYLVGRFESDILSQRGKPVPSMLRYYQAVAALQQAIALQPDDTLMIRQLLQQYETMGRVDVQLQLIKKLKEAQPVPKVMTDDVRHDQDRMNEVIGVLEETVTRIDNTVNEYLSKGTDRFQVAGGAYQAGGLLKAIKTLEEDAIYLATNPVAKVALGSWLMEVGRIRDAAEIFDGMEGLPGDSSSLGWRDPAAISALIVANYDRSIKLWTAQTQTAIETQLDSAMHTLPFITLNPQWAGPDSYPTSNVSSTARLVQNVRLDGARTSLQIALAQMEKGANEDAVKSIRTAIELNPSSHFRPLLKFYLECLTGEKIDLKVETPASEELFELLESGENSSDVPAEKQDAKTGATPDSK